MTNTLLVVGNGFDKKCGLKSSFSDYYEFIFSSGGKEEITIKKIYDLTRNNKFSSDLVYNLLREISDYIPDKLTIWDIYIFIKMDEELDQIMWFDVERIIHDSFHLNLLKTKDKFKNFWDYFIETFDDIYISRRRDPFIRYNIKNKSCFLVFLYFYFNANSKDIIELDNENKINKVKLYEFLKSQLELYEENFRNYLKPLVHNDDYKSKKKLYYSMLRNGLTNVLSFNYTNIAQGNDEVIENVHGTLFENLSIIGIDSSYVSSNDISYQFTKTYRKIEQFTKNNNKKINTVLVDSIKTIIFYGHSLNEQDYSYFKSIFDHYNLYGHKNNSEKNIKLIFYYSLYPGREELLIKKDAFVSVIKLINSYDETFKSEHEKGNNLLHKLLLENRLELRNFDNTFNL